MNPWPERDMADSYIRATEGRSVPKPRVGVCA